MTSRHSRELDVQTAKTGSQFIQEFQEAGGRSVTVTNNYTVLGTGKHYFEDGEWKATQAEFEEDMAKAAPQLGMTLAQTVAWVRQNGREGSVKARLREEKALNYLIDKASIKDE